ncbi:MAG: ATP-binding cassette domain-containing protein [Aeromicrobium sp.]|uniref:ATP-binding cassette domain-containing protein n=1 Tax=Aeromicrobium sp. TaxID=1871063 RepID=UPI0039E36135
MPAAPHDPGPPRLRVRAAGRAYELDGPQAALGRLSFQRVATGWLARDEGLDGGLHVAGEQVRRLLVPHGTSVTAHVGGPAGPSFTIDAPPVDPPRDDRRPAPTSEPALVARGLSVRSPDGAALLSDVDVALAPGTLTAVIGPSGAGKSTLLRALSGLTPMHAGAVWWRGHDVGEDREELRSLIGYVPQEEIQHPQLDVRRSLTFSARLRLPTGTRRARRVAEVLAQVGLDGQARRRIASLSGGQRKRVSIATELLTAPPLLFLDEPTSGLDPGRERLVMRQLREQAVGDATGQPGIVVVATHSMLGLDLCDTVIVMARGGRVVHAGPPEGLLDHFDCADHPELFDLLESEPEALPSLAAAKAPVARRRRVAGRTRSAWGQFPTLVQRNLAVLFADRLHLGMLLLMPLTLAALTRVVPGDAGLTDPREAGQRLAILVIAATLTGTAMTVRELVQERSVFRRERAVGLSTGAYLASKVVVFATACFAQGVLLTWLALLGLDAHTGVFSRGWLEVALPIGLLAAVTAVFGLAVSALVRSTEQTAPALVALVMSQVVLSSTLVRVDGRAPLEQVAWLSPARWAHAAAAASVDLDAGLATPDRFYSPTATTWSLDLALLGLFGALACWLGLWALRRTER